MAPELVRQYSLYLRELALPVKSQGEGSCGRGRYVLVQHNSGARRRPVPTPL